MIRKVTTIAALIALASLAGTVQAGGDPVAGKDKSGLCQGCHGEDGMSVNPECPNLAGQRAGYIIKQVGDFQKELRNNPTMSPMAAMVTDVQDLKDIAAYFESRASMAAAKYMMPAPSDKKSIERGRKIFEEGNPKTGLYGCINCHGQNGKGKSPTNHIFPVLGGQHHDYLAKQLRDFREGNRTNDPANMMMDIAKKLSEEELEDVVNYLSSL